MDMIIAPFDHASRLDGSDEDVVRLITVAYHADR